jgi:hypothetical protein
VEIAKQSESALWQTIAECCAELLERRDRLGFPLLRTRGERDDGVILARLHLRVTNDSRTGPTLAIENSTFEDSTESPIRYDCSISGQAFEAISRAHKQENRIVRGLLGSQRLKLARRTAQLLSDCGGLVHFFRSSGIETCRAFAALIESACAQEESPFESIDYRGHCP